MLKHAGTYEIMTPESVGLVKSELVLGKHSGRAAFRDKLTALGYGDLSEEAFQDSFTRFKTMADKKKEIFDEDLIALIEDEAIRVNEYMRFVGLQIQAGTKGPQIATLDVIVNGKIHHIKAEGNGPVDAIFKAIRMIEPHEDATLALYQVHAVTGGTDAQAEVTVRLEENGLSVIGQGADVDTLVASCRAYINGLNKLLTKRQRRDTGDKIAHVA
jgi:2-isopropylmalate synthase